MPRRLIYVPIESYKSRSTEYMSCAGGVYESCFTDAGINFTAIRPFTETQVIRDGVVVDYHLRATWGFTQVSVLLNMLRRGELDPKHDVIYFEDFWTPGFEMIPYAQSLHFGYNASHVKVFSFCHAQSTDPNDFTAPMHWWMRPMEKGWANYQSAVMCASREMINQWSDGGLPWQKLRHCGLSFHAGTLRRMFGVPDNVSNLDRKDVVVFSSRWDKEKNPWAFCLLAREYAKRKGNQVQFVVCTGLPKITSNEPELLKVLEEARKLPNFHVYTDMTKVDYFRLLRRAKVQFNCAAQDFVSYTLLDAMLNGCKPLYPNVLTFPDALNRSLVNLYSVGDDHIGTIKNEIIWRLDRLISEPWEDYSWVWKKYETSTKRKLEAMQFDSWDIPSIEELNGMTVDEIKEWAKTV